MRVDINATAMCAFILVTCAVLSCSRNAGRGPAVALHVPHTSVPIPINAAMEGKRVWESEAGSTANLTDENGKGMVPYTEVKARWDEDRVYFWMYAGDLDLEGSVKDVDGDLSKDDAFHLEFGSGERVHVVEVSVLGTISDAVCTGPSEGMARSVRHPCDTRWQSGAVAAVDVDGTLNRLGDNDEEWIVEMAIPFKALGLTKARPGMRVPFAVRRCEIGQDGPHACGAWGKGAAGGELILEP